MSMRAAENHEIGLAEERGIALLGALMVVLVLSIIGLTTLNLATQEVMSANAYEEDRAVHHAADAALELVVQWFHDPVSVPAGPRGLLFSKRATDAQGAISFFDAQGVPQFKGTPLAPDILFDADNVHDDQLLNHPEGGWFRSLKGLARILKLRVYGPSRPGLLCTIDVTVAGGRHAGIIKTVSAELGSFSIPPLTAAFQGGGVVQQAMESVMPVAVHWGALKLKGDVRFRTQEDIPTKTHLAPVTGHSYAEMHLLEDRWIEIWSGGAVSINRPSVVASQGLPMNVHPNQDPSPGLRFDEWRYEQLKHAAMLYGSYYALDRDGLLYKNGTVLPGTGLTPDEAFESRTVGDHHGLVFVDTLDQQPPRADNLGRLTLTTDYAEGMFVFNAHVLWRPRSTGQSVPALSPSSDGESALGSRMPVQLSSVNLKGALYTPGNLAVAGHLKVFGGVLVQGSVATESGREGLMEVWYDEDLRHGLQRGVPLVYVMPGTWQVKSS